MRLTQFTDEGQFLTIAEMYPPSFTDVLPEPLDAKFDWLVERIIEIEDKIDAVLISDVRDTSKYRVDTFDTTLLLEKEILGLIVIPTLRLRDITRKTLYGKLLAAFMHHIENVLFVIGDAYTPSEEKNYSANLNDVKGVSYAVEVAKRLEKQVTNFKCCAIAPIDLNRLNSERYIALTLDRQAQGVDIFFGQPVMGEINQYLELVDKARQVGINRPIIHCLFPFYSHSDLIKSAERFKWPIYPEDVEFIRQAGSGVEVASQWIGSRYRSLYENRRKIDGVFFSSRGNVEVVTTALKNI